jgi:hypothetical protein
MLNFLFYLKHQNMNFVVHGSKHEPFKAQNDKPLKLDGGVTCHVARGRVHMTFSCSSKRFGNNDT